ncbi:MAG TPA: hypothetical protein VFV72_01305 [Candidatus Limnocylindrales bacterium]|nr:hypothetical protein [Candidatus Limnocylindrales bacterium]
MAERQGVVGSIDDGGYLRFRHITVDHDELMEESLEEEGVLYACPICAGETVYIPRSGSYQLPGGDGTAGEG